MARLLILVVIGIFASFTAQADIGAVGNPNDPKPATQAAVAASEPAETKPQAEPKPLVEITFDQNYVNYITTLNQGVAAAEKAKPGVVYNVVSYLPAPVESERQNARMNERAENNLRAVVSSLRQKGVPVSRIHVSMKPGSANYDTVKVFVE
jgi:hypothetical protein